MPVVLYVTSANIDPGTILPTLGGLTSCIVKFFNSTAILLHPPNPLNTPVS